MGAAAPRGEEEARWGEEERRGEGARRGGERRRVRRLSPQATLLGLGVLLLLAAGATFLAVTWNSLPVTVQAGIMAALALSALAGAVPASRRGLAGTAEALAVLGYGLLAVDFYGARALDLIPAASIDGLPYAGLCCTSVALLNLLLPRLAPKVTTFGIAAVIVSQAPVFLLMVGRASTASLLLALLAQVVGTVLWTAGGTRAVRLTGLSCAALVYAGILIVGPVRVLMGLAGSWTELVTVPPDDLGLESVAGLTPVLATALVVGLAALTGVVLPRRVELAVTPPSPLTECLCAAVAALTAAATLPQLPVGGRWWVTALATGVVLADLLRERRTGVVTAMLSSAAMVVVGLDLMLCLLWRDLLQLGLIAAIVGALALVAYRKHRLPMATVAPVVSIAAQTSIVLLIADGLLSAWSGAMALAVVAAASIGATARWVGLPPERGVLAAAGLAVVLAELAVLPVSALTGTGLVLTIAAAPLVAYGMQPGRRPALLVATLLFGIANTAFVTDAGTTTLEWFTVPPAMLMLTIGLVGWRHRSSWVSLGPGLLLGLVPSALVAGNSPGPVRLVLVVAAAVVVVLLGVRFSLQAPFAVGTQVLAKVALWQLFEVAPLIPRWITLGLAGVIMLAVGASYERRLQEAKQAVRWVGALR